MNTLNTIWQFLYQTPWWVYTILIYCFIVGLKSAKGGTVTIWKLLLLPVIFVYLSVHSLTTNFQLNTFVISSYIIALVIGSLLGVLQGHSQKIAVDRTNKLIHVPGTWSTLIIILIIFISKYYFGYSLGVDPHLLENTHFEVTMLAVSGITAGLFLGRTGFYCLKLLTAPSTNLKD